MQLSPLTALLSHAVSPQDFTNSSGGAVGAGVCGVGSSGRRSCNQANIAASADLFTDKTYGIKMDPNFEHMVHSNSRKCK